MFNRLLNDMKAAMKAGDTNARDCIRTIISEVKNLTVNAGKPITDEVCMKVFEKSKKQHLESIQQFTIAGRTDLAEKEKAELAVISSYLPEKLDSNATRELILKIADEQKIPLEKPSMGRIMKALKASPNVDGKTAAACLQALFADSGK